VCYSGTLSDSRFTQDWQTFLQSIPQDHSGFANCCDLLADSNAEPLDLDEFEEIAERYELHMDGFVLDCDKRGR
jgi:hypothetical protein